MIFIANIDPVDAVESATYSRAAFMMMKLMRPVFLALIVVTYTQRLWSEGAPIEEGARLASERRLRPVLMTTCVAPRCLHSICEPPIGKTFETLDRLFGRARGDPHHDGLASVR